MLYYQSAMHPWIKSDKPGRCTICGMELTPVYEGEAGLDAGGDLISLSASSIRVLNVQTTEVKTQALIKTLTVAAPSSRTMRGDRCFQLTPVGGSRSCTRTSSVRKVKAGEPLAEFYSPMLLQAEREYRAVANSTNADLRTSVATRLRQMGLTPEQIAALPEKASGRIDVADHCAHQRHGNGKENLRRTIRARRREAV